MIEDQEYSSIRPLIDWLDYNGYTVVTKATKEFVDQTGRRKVKGNMDIELAVDAMELAPHIDHMVLFSGDGDFRSLVESVQRRGVRVTVVSTISTQPPMVADELRRQADIFLDIAELQSKIGRDPAERRCANRASPVSGRTPRSSCSADPSRSVRRPAPTPTTTSRIDIEPPSARRKIRSGHGVADHSQSRAAIVPRCPAACRRFREHAGAPARAPDWLQRAGRRPSAPLDARLLIVGLAPGLRGANRTGRPFTGDYAGDLLYATLMEFGFARGTFAARADDGLDWSTPASPTRCAACRRRTSRPRRRSATCRDFLTPTIAEMPKLRAHRGARARSPMTRVVTRARRAGARRAPSATARSAAIGA